MPKSVERSSTTCRLKTIGVIKHEYLNQRYGDAEKLS